MWAKNQRNLILRSKTCSHYYKKINFQCECILSMQNTKMLLDPHYFDPYFFFYNQYFCTQSLFDPKICWLKLNFDQQLFGPTIFGTQNYFEPEHLFYHNNFWPKWFFYLTYLEQFIFSTKFLFGPRIVWNQDFLGQSVQSLG